MYFGVFLLAAIRELLRLRARAVDVPQSPDGQTPNRWARFAVPAAALLPLLFLAQLTTIAFMARHQIATPCWLHLPIPVVADLDEKSGGPAQIAPSFVLVLIAALQSGLLFVLHRARKDAAPNRLFTVTVSAACALSLGAAIFSPAMTSPDVYYYLTYAKLGFASFAAQPLAVNIPSLPTVDWCERRILPSAYGPGFIAYIHALLSVPLAPIPSIILVRAANAVWFLALLALLRAAKVPTPLVMLLALNPLPLFQYVANPHNDLLSAVLVVGAMAVVRRSTLAALVLVVASASFKLSFALIGALVFTELASPLARILAAGCAFAASFGVSYLLAGAPYFAGMAYYSRLLASAADPLQYLVALIAAFAAILALARQRYNRILSYAFPALRLETLFPWYAIWALPYAMREREHLAPFLILMPLMGMLMETGIAQSAQMTLYVVASITIAVGMLQDARTRGRT